MSETIWLGAYDYVKPEVVMEGELEDGDDVQDCMTQLRSHAYQQFALAVVAHCNDVAARRQAVPPSDEQTMLYGVANYYGRVAGLT
jgi:hypothetical protein